MLSSLWLCSFLIRSGELVADLSFIRSKDRQLVLSRTSLRAKVSPSCVCVGERRDYSKVVFYQLNLSE